MNLSYLLLVVHSESQLHLFVCSFLQLCSYMELLLVPQDGIQAPFSASFYYFALMSPNMNSMDPFVSLFILSTNRSSPRVVLTKCVTSYPSFTSISTRCEPINPSIQYHNLHLPPPSLRSISTNLKSTQLSMSMDLSLGISYNLVFSCHNPCPRVSKCHP